VTGRKEERERLRQERLAAQQAAQSSDKRRLYLGYAVAGLIVAAMLAGLFLVITGGDDGEETGVDAEGNPFPELAYVQDEIGVVPEGVELDGRDGTDPPEVENAILDETAELAGCELQLDLPDEGNTHINDEDAADVKYQTNPPTSGDHYGNGNETASGALADGAYLETPPVGRWVHSMEHGRVIIHYSPDLSEQDQLAIKGVFEESPAGVIMFPNPDLEDDVAIASWTQLATCEKFGGAATLDLLRAFRDIYRGQGPEGQFPLTV
jgi:Protein of unknown function (DUF3105)